MYFADDILYKKPHTHSFILCCLHTAELAFCFFQMKQYLQTFSLTCTSQEHLHFFTVVSTSRQWCVMHL